MVSNKTRLAAAVVVMFVLAAAALAQFDNPSQLGGRVDPRVQKAVDQLGYWYEVVEDGGVAVLIPIAQDRARPVIVESKTHDDRGTEVRLICSIARIYDGAVPEPVMQLLQDVNKELKGGQFVVLHDKNGHSVVVFAALVEADAKPDDLGKCIEVVCLVTQRMSEELSRGI